MKRFLTQPSAIASDSKGFAGLDRFRVVAAFLIVGVHTSPLLSFSEDLDFLVIRVFARIAVPYFLMATGFFLLPKLLKHNNREPERNPALLGFLKKTGLLYAIATVVYLPVSIYAGYYSDGNVFIIAIRNIIFDGTFYHLWYLPASIVGVLLLYLLGCRFSFRALLVISGSLYLFGLFGDSYFGVASGAPVLTNVFDALFLIFSFTRNGIFYAPVFLVLGALNGREGPGPGKPGGHAQMSVRKGCQLGGAHRRVSPSLIGFCVSLALMLTEGWTLHALDLQRHDSMYFMLVPCMYFLFRLTIAKPDRHGRAGQGQSGQPDPADIITQATKKTGGSPFLRAVSMWVYIVHPLCIIMVRGAARAAGHTALLVDNSLIHYVAVCLLSLVLSAAIAYCFGKYKQGRQ